MSKLDDYRKILLPEDVGTGPPPEQELAKDPLATAWTYDGITIYRKVPLPTASWSNRFTVFRSTTAKLYVVAVATLQQRGMIATPTAVADLLGDGVTRRATVARKLRWMNSDSKGLANWWSRKDYACDWFPLSRAKYGRTHQYWVNERLEEVEDGT